MSNDEYRRCKVKAEQLLAEASLHSLGDEPERAVAFAAEAQAWATLAVAEATRSAARAALEPYVAESVGQKLLVHSEDVCVPPCPIHGPSGHHMVTWPLHWNGKERRLERLCSHFMRHPDPDDLAEGFDHECDGCCVPPQ